MKEYKENKSRPVEGERKVVLRGVRINGQHSYTMIRENVRWWTPEIPLLGVRIGVTYCMN